MKNVVDKMTFYPAFAEDHAHGVDECEGKTAFAGCH